VGDDGFVWSSSWLKVCTTGAAPRWYGELI
jgi:hypothetical protein